MPRLKDMTYSREGTIAAVRSYYEFLTRMYLDESQVIHPPPTGWPSIVNANPSLVRDFGKSDEVMHLLAHLPYVRSPGNWHQDADVAPDCLFADWQDLFAPLEQPGRATQEPDAETLRIITEGIELARLAPPHLFALTAGHRDNYVMALDTRFGVVHWEEYTCPDRIERGAFRMQVDCEPDSDDDDMPDDEMPDDDMPDDDMPEDDMPEDEAVWRYSASTWTVEDFFEVLKEQFKQLYWLPISSRTVISDDFTELHNQHGLHKMLQDIYRQHGWPDLDVYNKAECLEAVRKAMAETYPDSACVRSG